MYASINARFLDILRWGICKKQMALIMPDFGPLHELKYKLCENVSIANEDEIIFKILCYIQNLTRILNEEFKYLRLCMV